MISLKHYLKSDHDRAVKLNDYYEYYTNLANFELAKGNFKNAEQCMRHATTMITELSRLNTTKVAEETLRELTDQMVQRRKDWF
ncbi:hypothetical protein ACS127_17360 [Amphibacillus sp. Q70]|uniref:hypothetical protein n=1 Tax=Amphibacillus sp. Q70 TaxID=3453416 RepID=UPI003F8604F9